MSKPGLVVKLTAKPERADEFAGFVERALEHVNAEPGTSPWIGARDEQDPTVFFVVDLFSGEDARQAHLTGEAAKLLLGEGAALLAGDPVVHQISLLAGKAV